MPNPASRQIDFRPLSEADFPMLTDWLAESHVRQFYQKTPTSLDEVSAKYAPYIRGEVLTLSHIALSGGAPFGYLQCYRNADWPEWAEMIGRPDGISIDLYIGDPAYYGLGLGRAMLDGYLRQVAFPAFPGEPRADIAHETINTAAIRCSEAVGFKAVAGFVEDGNPMRLFSIERDAPRPTL